MTKKDYVLIAKVINALTWNYQGDTKAQEVISVLIGALSNAFQLENSRFDGKRFVEACYKK